MAQEQEEPKPALIRHTEVLMAAAARRARHRSKVNSGFNMELQQVDDQRWRILIHVEAVLEEELKHFELAVTFRHQKMHWFEEKVTLQTNDGEVVEVEDDLHEALSKLLNGEPDRISNVTRKPQGNSHGKRDNGIETRRMVVIRQ